MREADEISKTHNNIKIVLQNLTMYIQHFQSNSIIYHKQIIKKMIQILITNNYTSWKNQILICKTNIKIPADKSSD